MHCNLFNHKVLGEVLVKFELIMIPWLNNMVENWYILLQEVEINFALLLPLRWQGSDPTLNTIGIITVSFKRKAKFSLNRHEPLFWIINKPQLIIILVYQT